MKNNYKQRKHSLIIALISISLLIIPMVSAYVMPQYQLDLYSLFVENVFGGFLVSVLGMSLVFFIWGMLSRMSPRLIFDMLFCFWVSMLAGYASNIIVMFIATFALFVFGWSLGNLMRMSRYN